MRDHTFEAPAFGVLGPVVAWNESSHQIDLKGPRHRAVLARLVVARGRVVPVDVIVDDLWVDPPSGATSAIRTFVSALRRVLEPDRAPRKKPKVIVTEGPGYAFHAAPDAVDAWEFERLVREAADSTPAQSLELLRTALQLWRGPAYAEFADEPWARTERSRLEELRLTAVERLASAQLDLGRAAEAIPDLDAHVTEHPWREEGWRLLALALYRSDRQGDALAVLRRARKLLAEELGIDPGPRLNDLESDILRRETRLDPVGAEQIFSQVSAAYDRTVAAGSKSRLESTVGLLRSLAVAGGSGLETARNQRLTIIGAAEQLDDVELTARIIGIRRARDLDAIRRSSAGYADRRDRSAHSRSTSGRQRTRSGETVGDNRTRIARTARSSRSRMCPCRSTDRSRSRRSRAPGLRSERIVHADVLD